MKKLVLAFGKGLTAGALIHTAARVGIWSGEKIAHFLGHVIAVVTLEILRGHLG